MITLNPNTKFSYNLIRGSNQAREKFVSKLNEQVFDAFFSQINTSNLRAKDIKRIYEKLLPEPKKIEVKRYKGDKFCGASDYIYDSNDNISGITLEIPITNSKVAAEDLVTIMHENTHVLATLANPKQTALTQKLYKEGKYSSAFDTWYDKVLYTHEEISPSYSIKSMSTKIVEATQDFLFGKNCKDKIHLLQDARYLLEQELFAHNEEHKFAQKLKKMGIDIRENELEDADSYYMFSEKIKILKQLITEELQKARKKIQEKNERKLAKEKSKLKLIAY